MNAAEQAAADAVRRRLQPTVDVTPEGIRARIRYGLDGDPLTDWPRSAVTFNPAARALVEATRGARS